MWSTTAAVEGVGSGREKLKVSLPKTGRLLLDMVRSLVTTAGRRLVEGSNRVSRKHTVLMSEGNSLRCRDVDDTKKALMRVRIEQSG